MKIIIQLFGAILAFAIVACGSPEGQAETQIETTSAKTYEKPDVKKDEVGIREMSVTQLQSLLDSGADVTLIDVRTPEEIADGKIADGALEFDYEGKDFEQHFDGLDQSKEYVIYCAAGGRSGKTVQKMQEMGFTNVYNLKGGYDEWKEKDGK